MTWLARSGLTARGVVYILIGVLALLIARGGAAVADQKGALAQVLAKPYGKWNVGLLAVGFAGYALWRLSEAAFGVTGEGRKTGPRLQSLARAMIYGFLAFTAVSLLQGSRGTQGAKQQGYAAQVMAHPGGRWAIALVGLATVAVSAALVVEGVKLRFMRHFPTSLSPALERGIRTLGRVGTIARGSVFALTGVLVIAAAWTYKPAKARGLDGALKTLRDGPYGGLLLGVVAAGLMVFGLYALCEARYRRI